MPDDQMTPSRSELHSMLILLGKTVGDLERQLKDTKETVDELEHRVRQLEYNQEDEADRRRRHEESA